MLDKEKIKKEAEKFRKENPELDKRRAEMDAEKYDALLDEPEIDSQYLDLGSANGLWYFAFLLNGKEAIVTSDKQILRNTQEKFKDKLIGENEIKELFSYSAYIGDLSPRVARDAIKKWLHGELKIDKVNLFTQIRDKILYYMDFGGKDYVADVQACWVLATYCYPLFHWFPHILFNAPSQSGKSKNAFTMSQMSFGGFDLGASAGVTPAQIFRTLEANRGTIVIDEFERLDKSESQQLVNQILNASAARDAYIIRIEQIDHKWRACKFPIFCPKIACNITGINPTSLSRFIGFQLLKFTDKTKGNRQPRMEKDKAAFKPIRDACHFLILEHWQEIKDIYEQLIDSSGTNLTGREADNWLPILTIAKWLGSDVLDSVMKYIAEYREIEIDTDDLTETLFQTILENVTNELKLYSPKEIAVWMGEELQTFKSPAHWIGRKLKQHQFKSARSSKGNAYYLSKEKVADILKRYFSTDKTTQTTSSILTTLSTLTTQTTETTPTTQPENSPHKSVISAISVVIPERPSEKEDELYSRLKVCKCETCGKETSCSPDKDGYMTCEACKRN